MKTNKNCSRSTLFVMLYGLCLFFGSSDIRAMFTVRRLPVQKPMNYKFAKSLVKKCQANEIAIESDIDIYNNICVSHAVAELSTTLQTTRTLYEYEKEYKWPNSILLHYPIATINNAFDVLTLYKKTSEEEPQVKIQTAIVQNSIAQYPLDQLIDTANCINVLGFPGIIDTIFINQIKEKIKNSSDKKDIENIAKLNPDFQNIIKPFLVSRVMGHLKNIFLLTHYPKNYYPREISTHEFAIEGTYHIAFNPANNEYITYEPNPVIFSSNGKKKLQMLMIL